MNESAVTITATENGPYKVEGPATVLDADGEAYEIKEGKTAFLCRCGASEKKPFCDATHTRIGFEAAERAVREAED